MYRFFRYSFCCVSYVEYEKKYMVKLVGFLLILYISVCVGEFLLNRLCLSDVGVVMILCLVFL